MQRFTFSTFTPRKPRKPRKPRLPGKPGAAAVAASLAILVSPAAAADSDWIEPAGGDFTDASNWSPAAVPGVDAFVYFDIGGERYDLYIPPIVTELDPGIGTTITLPRQITLSGLYVGDDDVTIDSYPGSSIALANDDPVSGDPLYALEVGLRPTDQGVLELNQVSLEATLAAIGSQGQGELKVLGGSDFVGEHVAIGDVSSGDGSVLVAGSGSTLEAHNLIVSWAGDGALDVRSGGAVTVANRTNVGEQQGSDGSVKVTGANSSWDSQGLVYLGDAGEGSLDVRDGARVDLGGQLGDGTRLGNTATGSGRISASGAGTVVDASGAVYVGFGGDGEMVLEDGAHGDSYLLRLGQEAGSFGRVVLRGADTEWRTGSNITSVFGSLGDAEVLVEDGALLRTGSVHMGASDASRSVVTLRGADTHWHTWKLAVSSSSGADSTVNVHSGSTLTVDETLSLHANGTFNLTGGTLDVQGLDLQGGAFNFTFGKLHLTRTTTLDTTLVDTVLARTYGSLDAGQHLSIDGDAVLETRLGLDGGTLTVDRMINPFLLDFDSGTLALRGGLAVAYAGPMGEQLTLGESSGGYGGGDAQHVQVIGGSAEVANEGVVVVHDGSSFGGSTVVNEGQIHLRGEQARLAANKRTDTGVLHNHGRIRGSGQVDPTLVNEAGALVQVTAQQQVTSFYNDSIGVTEVPGRLVFTATGNTNAGQIVVEDAGNELAFLGDLTNQATGEIHVTGGARASFQGGLSNAGLLTISKGAGDVLGDVAVQAGGHVLVADQSRGRFYGDVVNNGEVAVATGSTVVFLGDVSGAGTFTGGGTTAFTGTLAPGNSPGRLVFGGDVDLSQLQRLIIEIAGDLPGDDYDQLDVAGLLTLGGVLELELLSGAAPTFGDTFQLFAADRIAGDFTSLDLAPLQNGLSWGTAELTTTGRLTVIPEPASALLLALGGVWMLRRPA